VVVPLLEGGGSPLKFIEGLAYGLPVVATPRAAAGIDGRAGVHYLEAEGAEAFAEALASVLAHGAPDVAAAGRELAERHYSLRALAECIAPGALAQAPGSRSAA
jgi:glycosyltransferase involved in cell wall biosynthesis